MTSRWWPRAAALVAGGVPALSFPEADLWPLAFVALVPLILLIRSSSSLKEAALRSSIGGVGFFVAVHHWLIPSVGPFLPVLAVFLAALTVPWGVLSWVPLRPPLTAARLAGAIVVLPSAWVAAEFLRSWEMLGAPWGLLGATQWRNLPVLSVAALGGVWGLSFLLVAVNTAVVAAALPGVARSLRAGALLAAGALVAGAAGYGVIRPDPVPGRTVRIAGVQPGPIDAPDGRFETNEAATRALAGSGADLVVWGESSVGFDPFSEPVYMARMAAAAGAAGADVLSNVDARRGSGGIFKSSLLIGPDGPHGRYDKMRLVPFGEYVPLRPVLGWVDRLTRAAKEDRRRGDSLALLRSGDLVLGPLVCFESAFPDLPRRLADMGAEVVVVQSATTTFQESWAPEQHASLAAVRAVESGRPVVHATLSGASAAFDARGRRLAWFGTASTGSYEVDVPLTVGTTPYVRFGDWVPRLSLLVAVLGLAWATLRGRRR